MASFTNIVFTLFFVLNAVGQIPLFLATLAPYGHQRQQKIIIRELLIALGILILFIFSGEAVLRLIDIDRSIIGVSGGILLFLIALTMIFPHDNSGSKGLPKHEPLIVPLAIPVIAGPGSITAVMVSVEKTGQPYLVAAATFVAWGLSLAVLLASSYIRKFMGDKGLQALERLGGMVLSLIGAQMIARGVIQLVKANFF